MRAVWTIFPPPLTPTAFLQRRRIPLLCESPPGDVIMLYIIPNTDHHYAAPSTVYGT